jgi:hypothetical protein
MYLAGETEVRLSSGAVCRVDALRAGDIILCDRLGTAVIAV